MSVSPVPTSAPLQTGQTYWQKGLQKCREQPLVPLGAGATTAAIVAASMAFRKGDRVTLNRMLRMRVIAQGLTVAACVIGAGIFSKEAAKQKEVDRAVELDKIRAAGRPGILSSSASPSSGKLSVDAIGNDSSTQSSSNASLPVDSTAPSPSSPSPAASESFWQKWGVSGKK